MCSGDFPSADVARQRRILDRGPCHRGSGPCFVDMHGIRAADRCPPRRSLRRRSLRSRPRSRGSWTPCPDRETQIRGGSEGGTGRPQGQPEPSEEVVEPAGYQSDRGGKRKRLRGPSGAQALRRIRERSSTSRGGSCRRSKLACRYGRRRTPRPHVNTAHARLAPTRNNHLHKIPVVAERTKCRPHRSRPDSMGQWSPHLRTACARPSVRSLFFDPAPHPPERKRPAEERLGADGQPSRELPVPGVGDVLTGDRRQFAERRAHVGRFESGALRRS